MSLIPVGHFPGQEPGFNYAAAEAVYGAIMKMEPAGSSMFATMIIGGAVQHDLIVGEALLADGVREQLAKHGNATRSSLTRSFLSKRASGEDVTAVVLAAEVLAKAFSQFDYTPDERARRAHQQQRDLVTGKFVTTHHNIEYALGHKAKPLSDAEATALGIPKVQGAAGRGMSSADKLRYQTAYHQVAATLAPYHGAENAVAHLNYGPAGEDIIAVPATRAEITGIRPKTNLQSVSVSVLPSAADATTSPYDTLKEIGGNLPYRTDGLMNPDLVSNEAHSGAARSFRRLHSGSKLLDDSIGGRLGPQAQQAFKVGQFVGIHGPEAQRVIGPTVDRAAYRYRGTERVPDKRVTEAFAAAARQAAGPADAVRADRNATRTYEAKLAVIDARHERALETIKAARAGDTRSPERRERDMYAAAESARRRGVPAPPGTTPSTLDSMARITRSEAHRRRKRAEGRTAAARKIARKEMFAERKASAKEGVRNVLRSNAQARKLAIHGTETDAGWNPSAVLSYFKTRLPSPELNALQLKSGTVPPSEGVLLDRRGQLVTQAVGYGDDWYLPFNLNHLAKLRGGEYIRTRTWGGPTTEDLYTGLAAGAKSLSVVSHNGVYNIEFDPSFKGGRRYNDKAARMVGRYGHLLDTVKSGQVTNAQLDPSRLAEIDREVEEMGLNPGEPDFKREVDRLTAKETKAPTFSAAQRAGAAQEFLDAEALKSRTPDGREVTGPEFVNDWLDHQANAAYVAHRQAQRTAAGEDFTIAGGPRPVGLLGQGVAPNLTPAQFKAQIATKAGLSSEDPGAFSESAITAMGLDGRFNAYVEREQRSYASSLKPLKLDGEGYLSAMQALQEQFPYYINNVSYHPWSEVKPGLDTGYVNHGTNRPAAAEAGYFAQGAGAAGVNTKVSANSIRYQAGRTTPLPAGSAAAARVTPDPATTAPAGTPTAPGQRAPLPASAHKALQYDADQALLTALWGQTHISSGVHHPDGTVDLEASAGAPAGTGVAQWRAAAPALAELRGTGDLATWTNRLEVDPEGTHNILVRAMNENTTYGLFTLDPVTVATFHERGVPAPAPRFDRNATSAALRNPSTDYNFGRPVYDKAANPAASAITAEYRSNSVIQAATRSIGLPASVDDEHFEVAAQGALDALRVRERAYLDWVVGGQINGRQPPDHQRLAPQVEALTRATQLRRRYRQAEATAPPQAGLPDRGPGPAAPPPADDPGPPVNPMGFTGARRGHLQATA